MAKEWYLMKTPYEQTSGFENDELKDFASDSFGEISETDVACSVEICNYDLSEITPIRVVIQSRTQDTKLNSLNRQMLAPIGSCKTGMYVKYKNLYWLIVGIVDDNSVFYEKAVLAICNWKLSWIGTDGKPIQRWANIISASQYNNGESNDRFYFVKSDQLLVSLPDDDESVLIKSGTRFVIDKRCLIYERDFTEKTLSDTSKPVITYQLTRNDNVLYNFGDCGLMEFMATQDEQHDKDGYYRVNDVGYWLCEEPNKIKEKTDNLSSRIIYESNEIFSGIESSIFTAEFTDENGKIVDVAPIWTINSDFTDKLEIIQEGKHISISANNNKLINKSFELLLDGIGYSTTSITVTIRAFF